MGEWRPIETAPKDEKLRLLGFDPQYGIRIIKYDGWGGGTGDFEMALDDLDFGEGGSYPHGYKPTRWMPLPEPPKAE